MASCSKICFKLRYLRIIVFVCLVGNVMIAKAGDPPRGDRYTIKIRNTTREFILYNPAKDRDQKRPLVIVLHGGGFSAKVMERASRYNTLADRDGVIVLYPQGLYYRWNLSLSSAKRNTGTSDLAYLDTLISIMVKKYNADPENVFITGGSMGGILTWMYMTKSPHRIRAFAPMICSVSRSYMNKIKFRKPTPVMLINGTGDPLVKYEGNTDAAKVRRGKGMAGVEELLSWLAAMNGSDGKSTVTPLPDINRSDACHALRHEWKGDAETVLIEVVNGGHTFAAPEKVLPRIVFGRTCQDFDAFQEVWEFFMRNRASANGD